MRHVLAVLTVGAVLALTTSAALAFGDKVDNTYYPPDRVVDQPPVLTVAKAADTGSAAVAGPGSVQYFGPYFEQRQDNMGQ